MLCALTCHPCNMPIGECKTRNALAAQEVLSNVAVLNKAGPNKELWEVKKEFKHSR